MKKFLDTVFFSKKIDTVEIFILLEIGNIILLNVEGYRNLIIFMGKNYKALNFFAIVLSFGTTLISMIPDRDTRIGVSVIVCEILLGIILIRRLYYR